MRTGSRSSTIQSVSVAARVLRALTYADGSLPLGAVAKRAAVSSSLAHRYLQSLVQEGLAEQDRVSGRYDLGPHALTLGLSALRRIDVLDLASHAMKAFTLDTGLSGGLAVWTERGPTIVRWFRGPGFAITSVSLGDVLPLRNSATGRVFDAFLAAAHTRGVLDAFDDDRQRDRDAVRRAGFARMTGHLMADIGGLACPVFDAQGEIACAITCVFPTAQTDAADALKQLIKTAADASSRAGAERPSA